jgi:diacylglycerol kinase family enzyme
MSKPLFVVASPHAGTGATTIQDLEAVLRAQDINYQLKIAKNPPAAYRFASKLSKDNYSAIAAFGGDGTVIAVLKAAHQLQLPVLILPGGSANALAKGVSMPSGLDECIRLFASGTYALRYLNVALMDSELFFLDLHTGIAADSVMKTPRSLKKRFGQWAYYISGLKRLKNAEPEHYELTIDGRTISMTGYVCMVVNEGEHLFLGAPVFPWPLAGSLSVAIVRSMRPSHVVLWWLTRQITGRNTSNVLKTWRGQKVVLRRVSTTLLADDDVIKVKLPLEIKMSPHTVTVIAPVIEPRLNWRNFWLGLQVGAYRYIDHAKRLLLGVPSRNYCQVGPGLYVGGRFRRQAIERFAAWGITGIVSMQERRPHQGLGSGMHVLHLPTRDHTAPTLENLTRGVEFMNQHIESGGAVYVHCSLGEGRGPTMAIAYLMSRGMRLDDALSAIRRFRPFVNPNKLQLRQLVRWYESRQTEDEPEKIADTHSR